MAMSTDRITAVANWLMTNGIDPADVPIDSNIVVNEHTITLDVYARPTTDAGRSAPGPVIERRSVPCVSQPPERWPA
ncbi:hypothetical protein [Streptomyces sp. NPDC058674]|uniref:hypothetical protein n=1 Tax=Streptomyces sp. NPDC058674 TaxID=3346592 RepID=UPI00365A0082